MRDKWHSVNPVPADPWAILDEAMIGNTRTKQEHIAASLTISNHSLEKTVMGGFTTAQFLPPVEDGSKTLHVCLF